MQLDIYNFDKTIGAFHQLGNYWILLVSISSKLYIYEMNIAVAIMCIANSLPTANLSFTSTCYITMTGHRAQNINYYLS